MAGCVVVVLLFLGCANRDPVPTAPVPAGKIAEAWGFDFRIRIAPDLLEQVPMNYLAEIRKAAQAWENTIWNAASVEHIVMPTEPFSLLVTDDWTVEVRQPEIYLGWTDIEILVFVDEGIETAPEGQSQAMAYTAFFPVDAEAWPGNYMPITVFAISPFVAEAARAGTLDYDEFYRIAVHELGHTLGIEGNTLERLGKVEKTAEGCSYVGMSGTSQFSLMKNWPYPSVPMDANCGHWDEYSPRWYGFMDVMFRFSWLVPRDKLISPVSLGALEDLRFAVDYSEADNTAIDWQKDVRGVGAVLAKSVVRSAYCVSPRGYACQGY